MSIFTNAASCAKEEADAYIQAVLDLLGRQDPLDVLKSTPGRYAQLAAGLSAQQLRRSEKPGKWCIAEVLAHMADSEWVWGYRLRCVLAEEEPRLTGFDQDLWVDRLGCAGIDVDESLRLFETLRAANLRLLDRVGEDAWARCGVHSERGAESVRHMVRLYAGHDLVHLNQIERIRRALAAPTA